jgi:hypothetical protein
MAMTAESELALFTTIVEPSFSIAFELESQLVCSGKNRGNIDGVEQEVFHSTRSTGGVKV